MKNNESDKKHCFLQVNVSLRYIFLCVCFTSRFKKLGFCPLSKAEQLQSKQTNSSFIMKVLTPAKDVLCTGNTYNERLLLQSLASWPNF